MYDFRHGESTQLKLERVCPLRSQREPFISTSLKVDDALERIFVCATEYEDVCTTYVYCLKFENSVRDGRRLTIETVTNLVSSLLIAWILNAFKPTQ